MNQIARYSAQVYKQTYQTEDSTFKIGLTWMDRTRMDQQ